MSAVITKCLSRINPDMYPRMVDEIIIAGGFKSAAVVPALDLLDGRLMAAGLLTMVEPAAADPRSVV